MEGRPAAGINVIDLTSAQKAMQYGVSITGVYIQDVTGENAKKAGLKAGDLIYYLDDVKITDTSTLLNTIQSHQVGDIVEFTVVRDNEIKKIKVKLQSSHEAAGNSN